MSAPPYSIGGDPWPGLSKVIEECGELLQVAGKLMATGGAVLHWEGGDMLSARLEEEIGDVRAALAYFLGANQVLSLNVIQERAKAKLDQFWTWHEEQG